MRQEKLDELNKYIDELKTIEKIYDKPIDKNFLNIRQVKCKLNNGKIILRDKLQKMNRDSKSAVILPITENHDVILVIQPRLFNSLSVGIEVPSGYIEEGEEPIDGAARELAEETGYSSDNITKIAEFYQDEGCSAMKSYAFIATNCKKTTSQNLDNDEYIKFFECTLNEAQELIKMGYIQGLQSQFILEKAKEY